MSYDLTTLAARLDAKCAPDAHGCLIWTGAINSSGYASMGAFGKVMLGHRLAYLLYYGELPEMPLDHVCTVRHCVNPLHVEPVTTAENNRRAVHKRQGERIRGLVRYCPAGHAIDGDNARSRTRGGVECRQCSNESSNRHARRTRAEGPQHLEQAVALKAVRAELGWRQIDVANYLGLERSGQVIYSEWERGRSKMPAHHMDALLALVARAAA